MVTQGEALVVFERYLAGRQTGGNHAHLNCVGVPLLPPPNGGGGSGGQPPLTAAAAGSTHALIKAAFSALSAPIDASCAGVLAWSWVA
jgi:hypothetical protein